MGRPQPGEVAIGVKRKSEALQQSIQKRISLLRSMAHLKSIPDTFTARNIEEFLHWEDKEAGITCIGSANSIKKHDLPAYREMKRLLKQLRARNTNPDTERPPAVGASPLQQIKQLKRLNQALTDDLLRLRVSVAQLLEEISEQAQRDDAWAAAVKRYREKYGLSLVDNPPVKS